MVCHKRTGIFTISFDRLPGPISFNVPLLFILITDLLPFKSSKIENLPLLVSLNDHSAVNRPNCAAND
ncbi:hypothetical protein D3C73_714880 [compost metagenome]